MESKDSYSAVLSSQEWAAYMSHVNSVDFCVLDHFEKMKDCFMVM